MNLPPEFPDDDEPDGDVLRGLVLAILLSFIFYFVVVAVVLLHDR